MYEEYTNIYQAARNACGLTQERAAELLGLSVESIKAYERDATVPKDATVLRMVDIYSAPFLAVQHLRASTDLVRSVIPEISETDFTHAVIRWCNRIRDFSDKHRTDSLMQIADDGIIDDSERVAFDEILFEIDEIIKTGMAFKYIREVG